MRLLEGCSIVFQPIFQLSQQRIIGYEALLRGPKKPEWIIEQAVQHDLILQLDQAIHKMAIQKMEKQDQLLFLNCHPRTLSSLNFDLYKNISQKIVFEITENEYIAPAVLSTFLMEAKKRGFHVALDDFGAGYHCLSMLTYCDFDFIKLDKRLIQNLSNGFIHKLVHLLVNSEAVIIGEGIESPEDLEQCLKLNVPYGQGFYLSEPIPFI